MLAARLLLHGGVKSSHEKRANRPDTCSRHVCRHCTVLRRVVLLLVRTGYNRVGVLPASENRTDCLESHERGLTMVRMVAAELLRSYYRSSFCRPNGLARQAAWWGVISSLSTAPVQ